MFVNLSEKIFKSSNDQPFSFNEKKEKQCSDTILNRIERVMQKGLECTNTLLESLKRRISKLPFLKRFFKDVDQKEKTIITTGTAPAIPNLPDDMIQSVFNLLGISDIKNMALVNKRCNAHAKQATLRRAREYGFEGDDYSTANDYLKTLFQAIYDLVEFRHISKEYVIYRGHLPFWQHLDPEATFRNIKYMKERKDYMTKVLLNEITERGPYGLAPSVTEKRLEMFRVLLMLGADPNKKDNDGKTPFLFATVNAKAISEKLILLLLNYRANPNISDTNNFYETPLNICTHNHNIVAALCECGADVNHISTQKGHTALHHAVRDKSVESVRLLLQLGADRNITDKNGETPLDWAKKYRSDEKMVQIIDLLKNN